MSTPSDMPLLLGTCGGTARGTLVTREMLLKSMWRSHEVSDTGTLRLYMSQLRKKLEPHPSQPVHLLTEQGMGYRLVLD